MWFIGLLFGAGTVLLIAGIAVGVTTGDWNFFVTTVEGLGKLLAILGQAIVIALWDRWKVRASLALIILGATMLPPLFFHDSMPQDLMSYYVEKGVMFVITLLFAMIISEYKRHHRIH